MASILNANGGNLKIKFNGEQYRISGNDLQKLDKNKQYVNDTSKAQEVANKIVEQAKQKGVSEEVRKVLATDDVAKTLKNLGADHAEVNKFRNLQNLQKKLFPKQKVQVLQLVLVAKASRHVLQRAMKS